MKMKDYTVFPHTHVSLATNKWIAYICKQMGYSEYSFVLTFHMTKP